MTRTIGFGAGGGLIEQCGQLPALLGGQVGAKAAADGLTVHRPGAPQRVAAGKGEHGEAGPPVGLVGLALGQPGGGQLVHDPADWNMPLDGGGLLVSKEIRIEIDAEAVLQATAPPA